MKSTTIFGKVLLASHMQALC